MTASPGRQDPRNIRYIRRRLIALAFIFPLVYIGLALTFSVRDRQATIGDAAADARSIAAALNGDATRVVRDADDALKGAVADVQRADLSISGADNAALHAILRAYAQRLSPAVVINAINLHSSVSTSSKRVVRSH